MEAEELNQQVRELIQSPFNSQEFANLTSLEENWEKIDKTIKIPKMVGLCEEECPLCEHTIRYLYDKFSCANYETALQCPHCKGKLKCIGEFSGYTTETFLEAE